MSSISSISKSPGPIQTNGNQNPVKSRDKEVQSLNNQKAKLSEQIEAVNSNEKLDSKIKQERIQALRTSIQEIDAQIAQIQIEEMQEKINNSQSKPSETQKPEAATETNNTADSMNAVVKNHTTYDRLGKLVGLSKHMEGSIKLLDTEIKKEENWLSDNPHQDSGRSLMLENAEQTVLKSKREQIQDIKATVRGIDNKIDELVSDLNDNKDTSPQVKNAPDSPDSEDTGVKDKSSKSKNKSDTTEVQASNVKTNPVTGAGTVPPSIDVRV
ncbi:hypothetical protein AMQ83_23885 [Paenibacillus riograndensis]|nr:hypothetical protein AMQ83_23885 [Paenibacillus riograndensis]